LPGLCICLRALVTAAPPRWGSRRGLVAGVSAQCQAGLRQRSQAGPAPANSQIPPADDSG